MRRLVGGGWAALWATRARVLARGRTPPRLNSYGLPVILAALALATTAAVPSLRERDPFLLPALAVVVASIEGLGPGVVVFAISLAGGLLTGLEPWGAGFQAHPGLDGLVRVGVLVSAAVAANRLTAARMHASAAARASEARFRTMVERSADAVAVVSGGRLVYANQALATLHGVDHPATLVGRDFEEMLVPEDAAHLRELAAQRAGGEPPPDHYALRLRRRGGQSIRDLSVSVADISWDGTPALLAVIRDLSDQVRLEAAERERARLDAALMVARTVAHELNNDLGPVVGYADLLASRPGVAGDPVAAGYVRQIADASQHSAATIRRLQQIARLEQSPSPLDPNQPLLDLERSVPVPSQSG